VFLEALTGRVATYANAFESHDARPFGLLTISSDATIYSRMTAVLVAPGALSRSRVV
jgi:hypothetical protein